MISAKIIADSINAAGNRITTFELIYHRFIHGELMTHRMFSRNASSSRAIPIQSMMDAVEFDCAIPVYWGLDQKGMQASEEHPHKATCEFIWQSAANAAIKSAAMLKAAGLHKQIANRVLEPYQWMKTIVTATEFDNFWWLRCHEAAQPEIHVLAEDEMYRLYKESTPVELDYDEWHLPYVEYMKDEGWYIAGGQRVTLEQAIKISASCCAQVSYRKLDDSLEKALDLYERLVENTPVHASPFEHIGTPMRYNNCEQEGYEGRRAVWERGITHMDRKGDLWSGNFKGWVQYRQLLDGNNCTNYVE